MTVASMNESGFWAAINRRLFIRAIIVVAVIASGVVVMTVVQHSLNLTIDKPPMPLPKELSQVKKAFGGTEGQPRYKAHDTDDRLDPEVVDALGTNKYLLRKYEDSTKQQGEVGRLL